VYLAPLIHVSKVTVTGVPEQSPLAYVLNFLPEQSNLVEVNPPRPGVQRPSG
jgi:hypothetical protein